MLNTVAQGYLKTTTHLQSSFSKGKEPYVQMNFSDKSKRMQSSLILNKD